MRAAVVALALAAALAAATPASAARDDQWVYRDALGDGSKKPVAVFLSWDYDRVLFEVTCEGRGGLSLRYFGDGAIPLPATKTLVLMRGDLAVTIPARRTGGALEGWMPDVALVTTVLSRPGEVTIEAPNEMGEPWYVGEAAPLRRVAEACR